MCGNRSLYGDAADPTLSSSALRNQRRATSPQPVSLSPYWSPEQGTTSTPYLYPASLPLSGIATFIRHRPGLVYTEEVKRTLI